MNKIKLFGLVAILIAFVTLTGCDQILDAFYPEYAEKYGHGARGNVIRVWVEV